MLNWVLSVCRTRVDAILVLLLWLKTLLNSAVMDTMLAVPYPPSPRLIVVHLLGSSVLLPLVVPTQVPTFPMQVPMLPCSPPYLPRSFRVGVPSTCPRLVLAHVPPRYRPVLVPRPLLFRKPARLVWLARCSILTRNRWLPVEVQLVLNTALSWAPLQTCGMLHRPLCRTAIFPCGPIAPVWPPPPMLKAVLPQQLPIRELANAGEVQSRLLQSGRRLV